MKVKNLILLFLIVLQSFNSIAKVSQEQADKLGVALTPVGAEMHGNSEGSIPAYTGGVQHVSGNSPYENRFKDEKPLFVITAKNLAQYEDKLTEGQRALFKKFPDSYTMPIYKTHRSAASPQSIYEKAKKNAVSAQLVDGGNGLLNFDEAIPFAIPETGLEVIWNHISRFRGGALEYNSAHLSVQRNGEYQTIKTRSKSASPYYLKGGYKEKHDNNILFYFTQLIKSPARFTGNNLLIHETINQVDQPRMAWSYNAGQRRVRRAPQVAYDSPVKASDNLRTSDQIDMYNGAPDRYNWKLIGKKEIYIPYNAYKLIDQNVSYDDIVEAGHINRDYTRYELHRVWQVEATLKEGGRHIYAKRIFYIDEDSWQIALADHYDGYGELWRVSEGHGMQFAQANTFLYASTVNYDLLSGRYMTELTNEERNPFNFDKKMKRKEFTSSALRRSGKR